MAPMPPGPCVRPPRRRRCRSAGPSATRPATRAWSAWSRWPRASIRVTTRSAASSTGRSTTPSIATRTSCRSWTTPAGHARHAVPLGKLDRRPERIAKSQTDQRTLGAVQGCIGSHTLPPINALPDTAADASGPDCQVRLSCPKESVPVRTHTTSGDARRRGDQSAPRKQPSRGSDRGYLRLRVARARRSSRRVRPRPSRRRGGTRSGGGTRRCR